MAVATKGFAYSREMTIAWMKSNQETGAFNGFPEENMDFEELSDDDLKYYFYEWISEEEKEESDWIREGERFVIYDCVNGEIIDDMQGTFDEVLEAGASYALERLSDNEEIEGEYKGCSKDELLEMYGFEIHQLEN